MKYMRDYLISPQIKGDRFEKQKSRAKKGQVLNCESAPCYLSTMSRPLCIEFSGALYHAQRGTRREIVASLLPIKSGGYSMKEVGYHFGVQYSSVSKIIKQAGYSQFKT